MSQVSFENFARAARQSNLADTEIAGRYAFQAVAERQILPDILAKLDIKPTDRLLEIGCGPGNLLIPLSYFVAQAIGIDNTAAIDRLNARAPIAEQMKGIAGNFLDIDLGDQVFDKILAYSVLHYLTSEEEVVRFIDKALSLCAPGGRLLLGDLTNRDHKARFANSTEGRKVRAEWEKQVANSTGHPFDALPSDNQLVAVDDNLILDILKRYRQRGHEAYLLPQPPELPFGGSREDILIVLHR